MNPYLSNELVAVVVAPFVGSFLALLAGRYGSGRSVLFGRSTCDSCGRMLAARDLVPLVSWTFLRGRCRNCGARIDAATVLIELAALIGAVIASATLSGPYIWAGCILAWWLIAIAAIDAWHLEIPDWLSLPLLLLGLLVALWQGAWPAFDSAIGAACGFAAFTVIAWVYRRVRGRVGLGEGDARLLAAAGAWVGWQGLASVVLYGAVAALAYALAAGAVRSSMRPETAVPFGPFLGLGLWITWISANAG